MRADFIQIQVQHRTGSLPHTFSVPGRTIDELLAHPIWDRMQKRTTIPIVLRVANSGARWIERIGPRPICSAEATVFGKMPAMDLHRDMALLAWQSARTGG